MAPNLIDRFRGCLLGLAVGDALGAPFEGLPASAIYYEFGGASAIYNGPPQPTLTYTDDTQMAIALAETLVAAGHVDEATLVARFVANYDPMRGYGQGARRILETMRDGGDWRHLAKTIFPGGSLGNGAAMRVAPVALLFHDDRDRLLHEAHQSALPTHTHPVGIDGARILALAIALAMDGGPFDRADFYQTLVRHALTDDFRTQLARAAELTPDDTLSTLGHTLEAHKSVVTAIACFALSPGSYKRAVCSAISLGDDTDTLAAMAGAISGTHLGIVAVPERLITRLENGPAGRAYIDHLATQLYDRHAPK